MLPLVSHFCKNATTHLGRWLFNVNKSKGFSLVDVFEEFEKTNLITSA
jgi:hypothetical protein